MKRIIVVGAGFGGMQAGTELDRLFHRRADADIEILLVSDQNHLLFTPLLPQIASSYTDPRHIVRTVRDMRGRRKFRFRRDTVRAIDLERRTLEVESGNLDYDSLILAVGSQTNYFGVPGAHEHTWDYKTLEDAVVLRDRIIDLCEHADHSADAALRRAMLTFVVVGGGYTGVELVCEMRDFLFRYVAKRYRGISEDDLRLVVVESEPDVLRGVAGKLAAHGKKRLAGKGIEVRTSTRVTRCFEGGVEVKDGETLAADTVIWAAGVRAHPLVQALPVEHDRIGRAIVNPHLQIESHPEVYVIGDSAASRTAMDAPRVAPVAIAQAKIAARNIAHAARKEALESYEYESKGMLVSLGMNYAVVQIAGLKFSGYFAWLFWNAIHLYKLAGLKKQLQVASDWMLATVFPRDAAIVRRPQRCRMCAAAAEKSDAAATK